MRKPAPSSTIFGRVADEADRRPTGGAIHPQIPPSLEVFLVVSPMRLIADQREARYTFKLLPLGNVFGRVADEADPGGSSTILMRRF